MKKLLIAFLLLVFSLNLTASNPTIDIMKPILNFLKTITPPQMVREGLALYGINEINNAKTIINWAKETSIKADDWYNKASIPWCSSFMLICAQRAKKDTTGLDLRALSWVNFGKPIDKEDASLGDVLVFKRTGGGHVGIMIGFTTDKKFVYVLGGNQSNSVNIAKISVARLFAVRRPIYNVQPESVKQYFFNNIGNVSTNEQ